MPTSNSERIELSPDVAFVVEYYDKLFDDIGDYPGSHRDRRTVLRRIYHEGLHFACVLLPQYGKAYQKFLCSESSTGFNVAGFHNCGDDFPVLFGGINSRKDDAHAVRIIRQLCLGLKKFSPEKEDSPSEIEKKERTRLAAFDKMAAIDQGLVIDVTDVKTLAILCVARSIVHEIFSELDLSHIRPQHGPGVVKEQLSPAQKFNLFENWHAHLEDKYPFWEYGVLTLEHLRDCHWRNLQIPKSVRSVSSRFSRLAFVPKTYLKERIIGMEPVVSMFLQQGQKREIYHLLENHPMTAGYVNFTDQSINQEMALQASRDGLCETLDLEDASDRVMLELVEFLMPEDVFAYLDATRSLGTSYTSRDGVKRSIYFKKFAPMGSAVCFPVEAVVFFALAWATMGVNGIQGKPYVYGDDIVAPKGTYAHLKPVFESVSLKFSDTKCCTEGLFRESCGVDAFNGENVTPLYLKGTKCNDPVDFISLLSFRNSAYSRGWENVVKLCDRKLQGSMYTLSLPTITPVGLGTKRPYLFKLGPVEDPGLCSIRYNKDLLVHEILGIAPANIKVAETAMDDWSRLWAGILQPGQSNLDWHVDETGAFRLDDLWTIPRNVKLVSRWEVYHEHGNTENEFLVGLIQKLTTVNT